MSCVRRWFWPAIVSSAGCFACSAGLREGTSGTGAGVPYPGYFQNNRHILVLQAAFVQRPANPAQCWSINKPQVDTLLA